MPAVLIRLAALVFCLAASSAFAQAQKAPAYEPQSGQAGKDVVWVPTPQALVDKMLDMAKVTPKDYLIDLGAGDGRTVITAAQRGLRAHGIEYNPDMVKVAQAAARRAGASRVARRESGAHDVAAGVGQIHASSRAHPFRRAID